MKTNEAIRTLDKRLNVLLAQHPLSENYSDYRDEIEAIGLAIKALVVYKPVEGKKKK